MPMYILLKYEPDGVELKLPLTYDLATLQTLLTEFEAMSWPTAFTGYTVDQLEGLGLFDSYINSALPAEERIITSVEDAVYLVGAVNLLAPDVSSTMSTSIVYALVVDYGALPSELANIITNNYIGFYSSLSAYLSEVYLPAKYTACLDLIPSVDLDLLGQTLLTDKTIYLVKSASPSGYYLFDFSA